MRRPQQFMRLAILANLGLVGIKLWGFGLSGSQAVLSDALNSILDVFTAAMILWALRVGRKRADRNHPFGHQRAEPIVVLVVAVLSGILGFEVIEQAIGGLLNPSPVLLTPLVWWLWLASLLIKIALLYAVREINRQAKRPALKAAATDFRNDILASLSVGFALSASQLGLVWMDPVIALGIAGWIIFTGYQLAQENLKYLMGEQPDDQTMSVFRDTILSVDGVDGVNHLRAQYIGQTVEVEVHINLSKSLSLTQAHDIGEAVEHRLKRVPTISQAFVHIDPA